ncbi:Lrp/AsnC family transcriptional regulator, partial [Vibrio sp. M260118]|uniref:Lrp/AsnC family transcriptional regulator n=1 Tax=Vibrio sp. M260118 TaxID=3020896 RepID=UPI002F3EC902
MDKFDEKILQVLKGNGRISNVELSEQVGLSPSATLRRVQELEKSQLIKGYRAVLDNTQLGVGF